MAATGDGPDIAVPGTEGPSSSVGSGSEQVPAGSRCYDALFGFGPIADIPSMLEEQRTHVMEVHRAGYGVPSCASCSNSCLADFQGNTSSPISARGL